MHQVIKALCLAPLLYLPASSAVPAQDFESPILTLYENIGICESKYVAMVHLYPDGKITWKLTERKYVSKEVDKMLRLNADAEIDMIGKCS